jgi:hypothetical protein
LLARLLRRGIELDQLAAAQAHGLERGDFFFDESVRNSIRVKLFFKVGAHADPIHAVNGLARGTEARAVQEVNGPLLRG